MKMKFNHSVLIPIGILLLSACSKDSNSSKDDSVQSGVGIVSSVCSSCNVMGGGTANIITFHDNNRANDSILVINLPSGFAPGTSIKFSYKLTNDLNMIVTQDRVYPKGAEIVSVTRIE